MKIAQVAPIWYRTPPKKYGGTEYVVSLLTEQLVKKGHDVTLFATGDSVTSGKLSHIVERGLIEDGYSFEEFSYPLLHIFSVLSRKNEFDIIHFHFTNKLDFVNLALTRDLPNVVFTLHVPLPFQKHLLSRRELLETKFQHIPLISISNAQRSDFKLNFISTVYNSIEVDRCPFSNSLNEDSMFWMSRISEQKGTREAIQVAMSMKKKLIVCGKVDANAPKDVIYYKEHIEPLIRENPYVTMIPELSFDEKMNYYPTARLFLFPLQWEEPFGLVIAESMACGTPVVAYARGSIPELVKDGVTGLIINSSADDIRGDWVIKKTGLDGLCEAVEKIYSMPPNEYQQMRRACRARAEANFTPQQMVDGYEQAYQKVMVSRK